VEPAAPENGLDAAEGEGIASPSTTEGAGIDARPEMTVGFRPARAPSRPFIIALLLAVIGVLVFAFSASALFVFGVGVAIAFFLVPVVNWLEGRGLARWIAAILSVVVTLVTVIGIGLAVVLIIVRQGLDFVRNLPEIMAEVESWYASLDLPTWLREGIDSMLVSVGHNLEGVDQGSVVAGFLGGAVSLVGGMFAWFLLPFFLFYLLKDQPRMARSFYERVPEPWQDDVSTALTVSVGNFARYFKSEFIVGAIMFVIVTVGTFAIGTVMDAPLLQRFALLLGLVAFVMELIPQIGPILSYVPALLVTIPAGFEAVVVVSIFYFIIFNIEGSVLVPNLQGKMIDFTGASVLVLIAIGFALAGIIGAILALPLASIVRDLFRHFFDKAVAEDLVRVPVDAPSGNAGDP
jgi:predicted PurR-regulated permease PerM